MSKSLNTLIKSSIFHAFEYKISNIKYFKSALTHKSISDDNYERLEILGDSILQTLITEMLYFKYPNHSEGQITIIRQNLVNSTNLQNIFLSLNLMEVFKENNFKFISGNVCDDLFEAIIGAIYLDSDYETIKRIVSNIFSPLLIDGLLKKDFKTILQEYLHSKKIDLPIYKTRQSKNHELKYLVSCEISRLKIKESMYSNKVKPAEQKLASIVYEKIKQKA